MMDRDRDAALIRDCQRGDRRALELLVSRFERPVFNAAYRMLGNAEDASDITQTAFLKVFEHLDDYNPKYRFFSWIYRITINESINLLKKQKPQTGDDQLVSQARSAGSQIDSGRLCARVQAALMELDNDYRSVIILRHFSECTYREISDILHIPEKTVKSRLYTARQRLHVTLGADGDDLA